MFSAPLRQSFEKFEKKGGLLSKGTSFPIFPFHKSEKSMKMIFIISKFVLLLQIALFQNQN